MFVTYDAGAGVLWWTVDNPQAVGAAEPIPIPENIPFVPKLVPDTTPEPDPMVQYPGQGAVALWNDVYNYATSIVDWFGRHGAGVTPLLNTDVPDIINSAIGATIKSLGGYISTAHQLALDVQDWATMQFDALSANIGVIYTYFDGRISKLEDFVKAAEGFVFPVLQAEINQLRIDAANEARFVGLGAEQWATDHIFTPLEEQIGRLKTDIVAWSDLALTDANRYTDAAVTAATAGLLSHVGQLQQAVNALQQESEDCTQPMCDTFGPKTDLGKFLKAFKVAEWAALLAEIAALRADGLDGLLSDLEGWAKIAINDIEGSFFTGGKTLGETLAAI